MEPVKKIHGVVLPIDRPNVDTDAIIPKQFLKSIKRAGFGVYLFDEWRYLDKGEADQDCSQRPLNENFVLNQARYQGAEILLARENFGCGSSREHAPWALADYGFRAVISSDIADIFKSNALKNGLLPVEIGAEAHQWLLDNPGAKIAIDVEAQELRLPNGRAEPFALEAFGRHCLLEGVDPMGFLLGRMDQIEAYEGAHS